MSSQTNARETSNEQPNKTSDATAIQVQCTTTQNEDYSQMLPSPPEESPKPSFFSRMSSLGSTAAPILEQVYDRAHKKAVALKETNTLREAVSVVRATGSELAKDLYPVDSGSVNDGSDDGSDDNEEDEEVDVSEERPLSDDIAEEQSVEGKEVANAKSPMKAVLGAYTEFRTTGRYQRKKEEGPSRAQSPIVVGGADKVQGLGRLKLNNIVSMVGNNKTAEDDKIMDEKTDPNTRTYKRTHSYYEEAVKNLLQPGQRALFFGKGTMGVILKPTYLASWRGKDGGGLVSPTTKKGGVFIDALVPGGHAERSGVVFVGDHVVKIGNVDVTNMTLEEVVRTIADTERPSIMILMAEWEPVTVNTKMLGDDNEKKYFLSPLDLAFGYVNKFSSEGIETRKDNRAVTSKASLLDDEDNNDAEEVKFSSESPIKTLSNKLNSFSINGASLPNGTYEPTKDKAEADQNGIAIASNLSSSYQEQIDKLIMYSAQRTNSHEDEDQSTSNSTLSALLARAAFLNATFRSTLHEAFKECCVDPRKANFLEHFFSEYMTRKEVEAKAKYERDRANGIKNAQFVEDENDPTSSINQKKLLEIYLDLVRFRNEATVCSTKQLLDSARSISSKFLPDADNDIDKNVQTLPEYVSYIAFGGTENLQSLKRALTDEDEFFEDQEHDGFYKCRENLGVFLSMQEHFLTFLASHDCARMRAYLRGTSPFISIEPNNLLDSEASMNTSSSLLLFAILHLICMKEGADEIESSDEYGNFIKMDTMVLNQRNGKRVAGASSMLSCPIFIMRTLNQSMKQAAEGLVEDEMMGSTINTRLYEKLADDVLIFNSVFVSPTGGALSLCTLSNKARCALDSTRSLLASSLDVITPSSSMAKSFTSEEFSNAVQTLCDELILDYCKMIFPNFQRHIFHEWALTEAVTNPSINSEGSVKINEYLISHCFAGLPKGYSKKVLRQIDLPRGLSSHLPGSRKHMVTNDDSFEPVSSSSCNADLAIVFGQVADDDVIPKAASDLSSESKMTQSNIQRFVCHSLQPDTYVGLSSNNSMTTADVPESFEEYMAYTPFRDRPFKGMLRKTENNRMSIDGWEVSLTNVMIPVGKGSSDMLYSVYLTLSNIDAPPAVTSSDDPQVTSCCIEETCYVPVGSDISSGPQSRDYPFISPLFEVQIDGRTVRKMNLSRELKDFNQELKQRVSANADTPKQLIGISLVSKNNVIPAMRRALSLFYNDLCCIKTGSGKNCTSTYVCQPLVDLLSVCSSPSVEEQSLKCILEPYIEYASSQWVHRPLRDQATELLEFCGTHVLESLLPVPLALLFVTALLEQKIVFSSSRRSMLMAASVAVKQLLTPLNWTHLIVPYAPLSMVNDLIHYPAPFILGLSTDERQSASILKSLPSDVTLVDLDVGRVMLASEFVHDDDELDDDTKLSSQSALRSQCLVLAEFLGGIFGSATFSSWCSDSPLCDVLGEPAGSQTHCTSSRFSVICKICESFLEELISGIPSCCLWIEERDGNSSANPAIVFDEDLFVHIKKCRTNQLNLGQFNLVLRTFLRTQSLSTLISEADKNISLFT